MPPPTNRFASTISADGFPDKLSRLAPAKYRAQALLDQNPDYQNHALGPGNLYSDVLEIEIDPGIVRVPARA